MNHSIDKLDQMFRRDVETCKYPIKDFNHRAHLRLAYIYLVDHDVNTAFTRVKKSILRLLRQNEIDTAKFHVTLTQSWILAVRHFMKIAEVSGSSNEFIDKMPEMLDSKIMMTHYSQSTLFSNQARAKFVQPDLDPIPRY